MDKAKLKPILILLGTLSLGVVVGRFTLPSKVEEKEKIVYQDKIVEKIIYVKSENKKNNIETVEIVTTRPDGTQTKETKTVDKSESETKQSKIADKEETNKGTKENEKAITNEHNEYLITALAKNTALNSDMSYGLSINKRVMGPIYVGLFGYLDKTYGISLGVGF